MLYVKCLELKNKIKNAAAGVQTNKCYERQPCTRRAHQLTGFRQIRDRLTHPHQVRCLSLGVYFFGPRRTNLGGTVTWAWNFEPGLFFLLGHKKSKTLRPAPTWNWLSRPDEKPRRGETSF